MLVLSSDAHAAPSLPSLSVPDGDTSDHSHDCFSLRSLVKEPEPGNGQPSRSSQYCDLALISLRRPDLQLYHQFRAECFYDLCCTAWYRTGTLEAKPKVVCPENMESSDLLCISLYRVGHLVVDWGWVDFVFGCSFVIQILRLQIRIMMQYWHSGSARW